MPKKPKTTRSFLRLKEVCERIGISRTTLYTWVEKGEFPQPIQLGPRAIAWSMEDIIEWEQKAIKTRRIDRLAATDDSFYY